MTSNSPTQRILSVDALRGLAVMAIVLLHNIEHFNFYDFPDSGIAWIETSGRWIWDILFFIFAGKAYAIFALLFGFSFFIQYDNQLKRGNDFRLRFVWRLFLLFLLGNFNGAFFPGDILVLYSIIGLILPMVCKCSDKFVFWLAVFLMLQPMEIAKFVTAAANPDYIPAVSACSPYHEAMLPALPGTDFWEMVKSNLWNGQLFSLLWAWDHGRFFQTASLFLIGMLIGRRRLFADAGQHKKFWQNTLIIGAIAFIPLYFLTEGLPGLIANKYALVPANTIISSFRNFSFMCVLVSGFILLWETVRGEKILSVLVPYGKMSLTNYLTQSMIGSFIYFGYGLALWDDLGTTASFAVGVLTFIFQLFFCKYWLKHHKYGPFEYLWRKGTWLGKK